MNKLIKRHHLTRRAALALGGTALAAPFLSRTAVAGGATFRILAWEGYAEKAWVDAFQEATGATASVTYAGSVDEMFAKMQGAKGSDFDVVSIDTSAFDRYSEAGLLQPIDLKQVPNAANLDAAFANVGPLMHEDGQYGVPFAWGSLPLIYDKAQFATAPDSWNVMWDENFAQKLIALDDANNSIVLGAMVLGLPSPFNLSDAEFEQVKQKLIEQKHLLLTYYAGFDEGVSVFTQSGIAVMFSMGEPQVPALIKQGVDAAMVIPKEGAIGWLDCWAISSAMKDTKLANAWINACLDKSVGKHLTVDLNYGNTTDASINMAQGFTYADKLVWLLAPENFEKRVQVWNEVKAAV
jgi:spermidine/putrescine-binding protein